MAKKVNQLKEDEHIECINKLAVAEHLINEVFLLCQSKYNKTSPIMKELKKFSPLDVNGHFKKLISRFEEELDLTINTENIEKGDLTYYNWHTFSNKFQSTLCDSCNNELKMKQFKTT